MQVTLRYLFNTLRWHCPVDKFFLEYGSNTIEIVKVFWSPSEYCFIVHLEHLIKLSLYISLDV